MSPQGTVIKYTFKDYIGDDGELNQEIHSKTTEKVEKLTHWIADMREESLKRHLINLGWTPPKEA